MNGMRILGVVCAGILASSLGALAACGGSKDEAPEVDTAKSVSQASVTIAIVDSNGDKVGVGSGVLLAPRLVLTSGHLIAGKTKWVVTGADGKTKVNATRGLTYDWRKYDSDKSHPRKHDVGVIYLDKPIDLPAYPHVATTSTTAGSLATRVRGTGANFVNVETALARASTFPNAYLADFPMSETIDTGGAVFDSRGVLGVVSGRGQQSGKLHIARVDDLNSWLKKKIDCGSAPTALGVRAFAEPAVPKDQLICDDAGVPIPGQNPSGSTSSSSNDGKGGGAPGGGENTCSADDKDGIDSGDNTGVPKTPEDKTSSEPPKKPGGGSSSSKNGGDKGGSTDGTNPGGGAGSDNPSATNPGGGSNNSTNPGGNPDGTTNPGGGANGDGTNPGGNSDGTNPGGDATNPGGGAGANTPDAETCEGESDNPELCPPELFTCLGPACGGGSPDETIDYGFCDCGSAASKSTYLR